MSLREPNNHTAIKGSDWRKTAQLVSFAYGSGHSRAVTYLDRLATNYFWENANMAPLPWHTSQPVPHEFGERYQLHDAVINALAPSIPLRVVWGGDRRV